MERFEQYPGKSGQYWPRMDTHGNRELSPEASRAKVAAYFAIYGAESEAL
jgi:hypothetical protein